jgi:hypothetical protein
MFKTAVSYSRTTGSPPVYLSQDISELRWPSQIHTFKASQPRGGEATAMRRLAPPLPFSSSLPILLWRGSSSKIFCIQYTRVGPRGLVLHHKWDNEWWLVVASKISQLLLLQLLPYCELCFLRSQLAPLYPPVYMVDKELLITGPKRRVLGSVPTRLFSNHVFSPSFPNHCNSLVSLRRHSCCLRSMSAKALHLYMEV